MMLRCDMRIERGGIRASLALPILSSSEIMRLALDQAWRLDAYRTCWRLDAHRTYWRLGAYKTCWRLTVTHDWKNRKPLMKAIMTTPRVSNPYTSSHLNPR
jgi:hypothetical protein